MGLTFYFLCTFPSKISIGEPREASFPSIVHRDDDAIRLD